MLMKADNKTAAAILAKIEGKNSPETLGEQNAEAVESGALQGGEVEPETIAAEELMAAMKSGSSADMLEAFEAMLELLMAKRGR